MNMKVTFMVDMNERKMTTIDQNHCDPERVIDIKSLRTPEVFYQELGRCIVQWPTDFRVVIQDGDEEQTIDINITRTRK